MNPEQKKTHLRFLEKTYFLIILEFAGTVAMTYGLFCSQRNNYLAGLSIIAPLFVISDLTGSHFNSVITLILMIKPKSMGRISLRSGLIDIFIHIIGGICGGMLCLLFLEDFISPISLYTDSSFLLADFFGETIGTFTFISFVLVQKTTQSRFTNDRIWGTLVIVMGYIMGRAFSSHSGGVLNPGIALGIQISSSIKEQKLNNMCNIWIFLIGPFLGGMFSLGFFLKIYQANLKERNFQMKSKLIVDNTNEIQENRNL